MIDTPQALSRHSTFYSIFIPSFCDSNGDGIGDIPGVISKLDYIQNLGINSIWLSPIHPSSSYHKYDIQDYLDIDPTYGTKEDFRSLIHEAHKRNIRIVMDLVVNHTAVSHPWFVEACKSDESKYRQFYIWKTYEQVEGAIKKEEITQDSDNIIQWHNIPGTEDYYYGFFWEGMPNLNLHNPEVRSAILDVARYWLEEFEVDGFRLDAAKHIFPEEEHDVSIIFWKELTEDLRRIKSDITIVGEVWDDMETVARYYQGLPALFNFDLCFAILKSIRSGQDKYLSVAVDSQELNRKSNPDFRDFIFLSNHDMNRIGSELQGSLPLIKLAASILLTLPGHPVIYYGEEIGMLGTKPDPHIREPFLWQSKKTPEECSWVQAIHSTRASIPSLEEQQKDTLSIYQHYLRLLHFRQTHGHLFSTGKIKKTSIAEASGCVAYTCGSLLIIHNLSDHLLPLRLPVPKPHLLWLHSALYTTSSDIIYLLEYGSIALLCP